MARRRNRLLVPEAREGIDRLQADALRKEGYPIRGIGSSEVKYSVAAKLGVPLEPGYNGHIQTSEAGKVGGAIGGVTVRELIRLGQQKLAETNLSSHVDRGE